MDKNEAGGVLILNKPSGITSHDAVNRIRRLYETKQVGHTGTLDPLATGVLPVLVGRAVKASEYLTAETKEYEAVVRWGLVTDTGDITGKPLKTSEKRPTETEVSGAVQGMIGPQFQIPPMYSAIKIRGVKLYDLARQGIEVEREPRPIVIERMSAEKRTEDTYLLRIVCSKGTYIRSVCETLGERLGCGGTMEALTRIATGRFRLENAVTLEELEQETEEERRSHLCPTECLFDEYETLTLPEFYFRLFCNGCEIYEKKIGREDPVGTRFRLYKEGRFFALAEVRDYPEGRAVKAVKMFL